MKQILKTVGLYALLSAAALAQTPTASTGSTYDPVKTMWWVYTMIYGIFVVLIAIAILYHCGHGALGSHDGFGKVVNVLMYGGIGLGAVYVISHMTLGAAAPI